MNASVMYSRQTDSLWIHFTGDAITRPFAGTRLELVPALQAAWGRSKELRPDTLLLNQTGKSLFGGFDAYEPYYSSGSAGVLRETRSGDRFYKKGFVVGLLIDGQTKAYAFGDLNEQPVIKDLFAGQDLVVTFAAESATGGTFGRTVAGHTLTFQTIGTPDSGTSRMVNNETGSRWLLLTGVATDGEPTDKRLEQIPSSYSFWFSWKGWHPSPHKLYLRDAGTSKPRPKLLLTSLSTTPQV